MDNTLKKNPFNIYKYKCEQCGKPMTVIDYLIGAVCMKCCKKNHREVVNPKRKKVK